jgi:hypothetical protein
LWCEMIKQSWYQLFCDNSLLLFLVSFIGDLFCRIMLSRPWAQKVIELGDF